MFGGLPEPGSLYFSLNNQKLRRESIDERLSSSMLFEVCCIKAFVSIVVTLTILPSSSIWVHDGNLIESNEMSVPSIAKPTLSSTLLTLSPTVSTPPLIQCASFRT